MILSSIEENGATIGVAINKPMVEFLFGKALMRYMDFPNLDTIYFYIPHPALCEIPIDKVEINAGMFNSGR